MWARLSLVVMLVSLSAHATEPLLTGSLGRWLDQSAVPELTDTLANHPMFKGETIRIVALRDGKLSDSSNLLSEAVEERLTRRLLRKEGVRLAWSHSTAACDVPQQINYLLGVEMEYQGSQQYQLNISMIDVEEAVWVSGINLEWDGRLTSAERRAFREEVSTAVPGSLERPVPVTDADELAHILSSKLSCTHPDGIEGPVFFSFQPNADLQRVTRGLESELAISPTANVTHAENAAEWLMRLEAEPAGEDTFELVLTLEDPGPAANAQRAASVFVTGLHTAAPPRPVKANLLVSSISELGPCPASNDDFGCVDLGVTLNRPAYLLTFHTRDGELGYAQCNGVPERSKVGARRYRVRLPRQPDRSADRRIGFYVLATENAALARAVAHRLTQAPGACGERHPSMNTWLADLEQLLHAHPEELSWQAIHLQQTPTGLAAL